MEQRSIPLVDLAHQLKDLASDLMPKILEVIESCSYIQGKRVKEFETLFSEMLGINVMNCIGCSNGTSAISLALEGLGIGPQDEVITVSNTFIATAEAICHVGAKPIFVDIDPSTYCIDPQAMEAAITPRTKAILPVHIFGNPCQMDSIGSIAKKHSLALVEDCAQAHFARFNGGFVGTFGDAGTFSFYPGKNLGAFGDAGALLMKSPELSQRVRQLVNHGRSEGSKYEHDIVGYNQRMDEIQAVVLSFKLNYIKKWTSQRQHLAKLYNEAFAARGFKVIESYSGSEAVYHLYPIEVQNREDVARHLKSKGIASGVHYPIPLHLQKAFEFLEVGEGSLPQTEKASAKLISIPIYPELSEEEASKIAKEFLSVAIP